MRVITSNYSYFGWAASILLLGGILWLLKLNQDLKEEIRVSSQELKNKETQIVDSNEKAERLENLLQEVAQPNTKKLNLPGNELNAPNAFVTAFYNEEREELILDTSQLPDPPEGMVYQAWSLTFEPLTPRSIGVLAQVSSIDNNLFKLQGIPNSEGFGITLEPDGGSDTPNLEQLYALGTI